MKRTLKPMWWSLFAAGGMVSALFYPAQMLITTLLEPGGIDPMPYAEAKAIFSHGLFKAYLLVFVSFPLFHAAHRMMAAFMDFGLRPYRTPTAIVLYGGAILGTAFTIFTVVTM